MSAFRPLRYSLHSTSLRLGSEKVEFMPLTDFDFVVFGAIVLGLPVAFVLLNKWRPRAGWWMLAAVVGFIIVANAAERLITGTSPSA